VLISPVSGLDYHLLADTTALDERVYLSEIRLI